jgi:hypothetical protein
LSNTINTIKSTAEQVVSQGLRQNIVDLAQKELETQAKVTPQNHLQPFYMLKQEEKEAKTKQINKLRSFKTRRNTTTTESSRREQKLHNLSGWEKSIPTRTNQGVTKKPPWLMRSQRENHHQEEGGVRPPPS